MEFTEAQIAGMVKSLRDDFPEEIATRELALLELEDTARKGCTMLCFANRFGSCYGCECTAACPMLDWEKRHPEYANDELAMKIKVLEAGGEEAYREKQKRIEEAKKQAEVKKLAVKTAKDKVIELFMKAACDNADWDDEEEAALEAYVQARLVDK